MRIALFSYEFAGHQFSGGIGTYTRNAATMLANAGHDVEVFTNGSVDSREDVLPNLRVNCIAGPRDMFAAAAAVVFAEAHNDTAFDVMEGPEYGADAAIAARNHPEVPLVVKLHAPSFTIDEANRHYIPLRALAKFFVGGLMRGKLHRNPWKYDREKDPERRHALEADLVVANSRATAAHVGKTWGLTGDRLSVVPYSFEPSAEMLAIESEPTVPTVLFLGRIEARKGVLELARAIPLVLKDRPGVRFQFVGRDLPHPADRRPLSEHIRELSAAYPDAVEIHEGVAYDRVPDKLAAASICVFPSSWEAAGFVCMEAMSAARAVIGSQSGGMVEFIDPGTTGLLVPPFDPRAIARAIVQLVDAPQLRRQMGLAARAVIRDRYAPGAIVPLQIASYEAAIENAALRLRSTRWGKAA